LIKDFKKWLDSRLEKVPPTSLLGKAINYTLGQWHRLTPFLKDGCIPMDNNTAENAIRPFKKELAVQLHTRRSQSKCNPVQPD